MSGAARGPAPRTLSSLGAQLAMLALAAMAPLAALLAWNLHSEAEREAAAARTRALQLAEVTASETARFLGQVQNILNGLAARPAVSALDPARCDPVLADFLRLAPRFSNIVTLRMDGAVVCSAVPAAAGLRLDPSNLVRHLQGGETITVGRPTRGTITGRWAVPVGVALLDAAGAKVGAVALTLDLLRLPGLPRMEGLPAGTVSGIVAVEGPVLAHSGDPVRFIGTDARERPETRRILEVRRGVDEDLGLDGVLRIRGYTPIPGTDWIAVASMPAAEVYAPVRARTERSVLAALGALGLALALVAWWSARLCAPVAALAGVAARVAAGETAARASPGGAREIAEVAEEFNRMLEALGRANAERERLRQVIEATSDMVTIAAPDGSLVYANRAARALLGLAPEAPLAGARSGQAYAPAARANIEQAHRHARSHGLWQGEVQLHAHDGGAVPALHVLVPLRGTHGEVELFAGIARDITDRKRAEEAVREAEARLREVLDNMFPFVGLLSLDGRVLEANRAPLDAAGLSRDDVIGRDCAETWWFSYSPEVQTRLRAALARAAGGEAVRYDETIRATGGRFLVIDLMFSPLRDAAGRIVRIVGSAVDISDRKAAELTRQAYAKQLERVQRRLHETEENERRALARELHDRIGQGLATLGLNLKLAHGRLAAGATAEVHTRLAAAEELVTDTARQARDLMAELHPPALDDFGLAAALRAHAEPFSARVGVPVAVTGEDYAPRLAPGTEIALFRIAQEALANAAKHAGAGHIDVSLAASDEEVALEVADDGHGFDAGAGGHAASWGLAIMRERAAAAGLAFEVDSAPGAGTRVRAAARRRL